MKFFRRNIDFHRDDDGTYDPSVIKGEFCTCFLTHIIQKDLTKNASGQITDHYDLPQNPSVLSWR